MYRNVKQNIENPCYLLLHVKYQMRRLKYQSVLKQKAKCGIGKNDDNNIQYEKKRRKIWLITISNLLIQYF